MVRPIAAKLMLQTSDYLRNIRGAAKATRDFTGELNKAAQAGHLDRITQATAGLGVGLLGAAGAAVKMAADFDKQMSAVQAATHSSAEEIGKLRQAALDAGKDTKFSATDAAKGIEELSKAGVSSAAILSGGLKGALDLAAAGSLDVGEAAETAASALTQFRLKGKDVPHVADLLAAAAGKAQGSVHDMGQALGQSGLVAAQFGLSVEDTTGTLAAFASAGLTGSDAGTSFKQMLLMLANPAEKTQKEMKKLGIAAYDTKGNFVGVTALAGQLKEKLSTLTQAQRDSALAQIFGSDAIRAANVLYTQGASGIQDWIKKTNDAGYASETARIKTDNLAGDIERLTGNLETLAIEAGSGANSGLRSLVKTADGAIDAFSALPGPVQSALTVIAGLSGAGLLAGAGLLKAKGVAGDLMNELRDMGPRGAAAAGGLGKVASVAGKLGLAGAAVGLVAMGFQAFGDWVEKKQAPVKADIDKLTESIKTFAATGQITGELASKFGQNLEKIGSSVTTVIDQTKRYEAQLQSVRENASDLSGNFDSGIQPIDPQAVQSITDLDASLTKLVQGGGAGQAKVFLDELRASGKLNDAQFAALTARMPNYAQATKEASTANTGLARGFGTATANAKAMTGTLRSAIDAGQTLTDVWNQMNGALAGTDKAMLSANQAIRGVKDAFKENGKAIEGNSTKALSNRVAVAAATKAAAEAAQAKYEETGSLKDANKVYDDYIGQLRKTLHQAHLTDGQIDTLIGRYGKMPESVATKISTPGLPASDKAIKAYDKKINALARKVNTTVSVTGRAKAEAELRRLLIQRDAASKGITVGEAQRVYDKNNIRATTGGYIRGPGTETSDSIAARLSDKEYVVKAASVRKLGVGKLDHINRFGELPNDGGSHQHGPGFAGGGLVNMRFPVDVSKMKIPSLADVLAKVAGAFGGGNWPSSPGAQRGDSGVWRSIVALIRSTGPMSGQFGNSYRPGDPLWHGSGRAVDWMGYNQDGLASFLAARRPLELIHRTPKRDYAYTRGRNKGSFNNALMEAHRNHVHIAMANGGMINEHVVGVGRSGATYEFGEGGRSERVIPGYASGGLVGVGASTAPTRPALHAASDDAMMSAAAAVQSLIDALKQNGSTWKTTTAAGRENRSALINGIQAAQAAAQAKFAETRSVGKANATYKAYIAQLDASLKAMGINAKGRKELIAAYAEQPKYDVATPSSAARIDAMQGKVGADAALDSAKQAFAWTKPGFDSRTETGRAELSELFSYLGAAQSAAQGSFDLNGNAGQAKKLYVSYLNQLKIILKKSGKTDAEIARLFELFGQFTLQPKANRAGGLYQHAETGAMNESMIGSGDRTLYGWNEPATGGELFAPKNGPLAKTRQNVGYAVENWWGGSVSWNGRQQRGGGTVVINASIPITLGAEVITRQVRLEVDTAVGQVASAVIYQPA